MTASILVRQLYRSLLRAADPFINGTKKYSPKTLTCFLHRSEFYNPQDEDAFEASPSFQMQAPPSDGEVGPEHTSKYTVESLYRKLVGDVIVASCSNPGPAALLQVPDLANPQQLRNIIRREFRVPLADENDFQIRRDVGFLALKQLNKKLAYLSSIQEENYSTHKVIARDHSDEDLVHYFPSKDIKAAHRVAKSYPDERPDFTPPSTYLKPGTFLLAHPLLTGFFHRAVVCILERPTKVQGVSSAVGTYGVVVNKPCDQKRITLQDVFKDLDVPHELQAIEAKVGGPVNVSVQMLHMGPSSLELGGMVVPELSDHNETSTSATESNQSVFVRGNLEQVAAAIRNDELAPTDLAFFIGGSTWSEGQLEKEINLGFWIPCTAPISLALFSPAFCQAGPSIDGKSDRHSGEDLWLSMMMACGQEEAELAQLLYGKDLTDPNIDACDEIA